MQKKWNKSLTAAAISHAAGVFHARRAFHKSRKGFISLKKALANASAFFLAGREELGFACRLARYFCTTRNAPRPIFKVLNLNKKWNRSLSSRWNNSLRELWYLMLRIKWNEINPSPPQRFHAPQAYFTPAGHFTNLERDLFRWKKHLQMQVLFSWLPLLDSNQRPCG